KTGLSARGSRSISTCTESRTGATQLQHYTCIWKGASGGWRHENAFRLSLRSFLVWLLSSRSAEDSFYASRLSCHNSSGESVSLLCLRRVLRSYESSGLWYLAMRGTPETA